MKSSDEDNDGVFGNDTAKELTFLSSKGAKFVDQVFNGPNKHCLDDFRMDKHIWYKLCGILETTKVYVTKSNQNLEAISNVYVHYWT